MRLATSNPWPVWFLLVLLAGFSVIPLPDALDPIRPPLAAMGVVYWCMMWPARIGLALALAVGFIMDILHGALLGQNALALGVLAWLTLRFHLQIRNFPLWQLTLSVFALLASHAFILFWIDGIVDVPPAGVARWTQVVAGGVCWPPFMAVMDQMRMAMDARPVTLE